MVEFEIPLPPSVNHFYGQNGVRRFKTDEAKDWELEAGFMIRNQIKRIIEMKGKIDIRLEYYFKRERDLDNGIKPILDLLQDMGFYKNDNQVWSILAVKNFDKESPRVCVEISEN